jgi:hypothetical protein
MKHFASQIFLVKMKITTKVKYILRIAKRMITLIKIFILLKTIKIKNNIRWQKQINITILISRNYNNLILLKIPMKIF